MVPAAKLNAEIFDVGFTSAIGCALYKTGGCELMKKELRFTDAVQLTDHWKYKYLIDIDGQGYSAHFLGFMGSESAVLKSTVYREFFSDWIQPWFVNSQPAASRARIKTDCILFMNGFGCTQAPLHSCHTDIQ